MIFPPSMPILDRIGETLPAAGIPGRTVGWALAQPIIKSLRRIRAWT